MTKTKARSRSRSIPASTADHGPNTAAQCAGSHIEPVPDDPNGSTRRARKPPYMRAPWRSILSPRQHHAAIKLYDAAGKADKSGGCAIPDMRVDGTPRYGDPTVARMIRSEGYHDMIYAIPSDQRMHVYCAMVRGDNLCEIAPSGRAQGVVKANVMVGLDLLANRLRL